MNLVSFDGTLIIKSRLGKGFTSIFGLIQREPAHTHVGGGRVGSYLVLCPLRDG